MVSILAVLNQTYIQSSVSKIGHCFTTKRKLTFIQRAGQQTCQWNTVNGRFLHAEFLYLFVIEYLIFKVWKNSAILAEKEIKASSFHNIPLRICAHSPIGTERRLLR